MTLQSSGPISLGNVAVELGRTSTTTTSLGEAAVRTLAGVASGPISLSNLYGKSNESFWYATFGSTVVNFLILGTDSSGNIYASATSAVFKWDRDRVVPCTFHGFEVETVRGRVGHVAGHHVHELERHSIRQFSQALHTADVVGDPLVHCVRHFRAS